MAALEEPRQSRQLQHLDFGIGPEIWRRALERDRCDRILSPRDAQKCACQLKLAATKFKDRLPRQQMDRVSESLGPPKQSIANNWIVLPPILVAIALTDCQGRDKRKAICGND